MSRHDRQRFISSIATILLMLGAGAGVLMAPLSADRLPLMLAENAPAAEQASQGEVTERAVPALPVPGAKSMRPAATGPGPEEEP